MTRGGPRLFYPDWTARPSLTVIGGRGDTLGAALGPLTASLFFYRRRFMDPTVNEHQPGSAPSRRPPARMPLPASARVQGSSFPLPSLGPCLSSSVPWPPSVPVPSEGEVTPAASPAGWEGRGLQAGPPSPLCNSVQSRGRGDGPP